MYLKTSRVKIMFCFYYIIVYVYIWIYIYEYIVSKSNCSRKAPFEQRVYQLDEKLAWHGHRTINFILDIKYFIGASTLYTSLIRIEIGNSASSAIAYLRRCPRNISLIEAAKPDLGVNIEYLPAHKYL